MTRKVSAGRLPNQPDSVGRYEIVEPLGQGAMGVVYRARDTLLHREVAIKLMAAALVNEPNFRARFEREARIVAGINHPNVLLVYDLGYHTDGSPFIAMELLSGHDLAYHVRTQPPGVDDSAAIALAVLAGLARAHDRGIVHRDVKPANIFITDDGKVKVMDFGVARLTTAALTATGAVLGTAHYMSPEQLSGGQVDGRSDLFGVGCVLFEMLSSHRPFDADTTMGILFRIASSEPDYSLVPAAGQGLLPMLRRALQKDPEARYPSAREFAAELRAHLRENAASAWARHAAEVVELAPGSGSGPTLRPTLTGRAAGTAALQTHVPEAPLTAGDPFEHYVKAAPTAALMREGTTARESEAPTAARAEDVPGASAAAPSVARAHRPKAEQRPVRGADHGPLLRTGPLF